MKYFIVEGNIKTMKGMSESLLKEHMAYTQKSIDEGNYLFSGLKSDQTGGIFIMKASSKESLLLYLQEEPFYKAGIQTYTVKEFDVHYTYSDIEEWFSSK